MKKFGKQGRSDHDVLSGDRDSSGAGDGLGLAHQCRRRPGDGLPQDAHVRSARRARLCAAHQRQSFADAVRDLPAAERLRSGQGLALASSLYEAARVIGTQIRQVSDLDRAALEKDDYRFNVHILLGGQIKGEEPGLYLVYPQGNPLHATEDSPILQIGEHKYGRPILVRGIQYEDTTLSEAAKYALISMDSTMRSNVTVGPPIDLVVYRAGELDINQRRRLTATDPDLQGIHDQWEEALRRSVQELPEIDFDTYGQKV